MPLGLLSIQTYIKEDDLDLIGLQQEHAFVGREATTIVSSPSSSSSSPSQQASSSKSCTTCTKKPLFLLGEAIRPFPGTFHIYARHVPSLGSSSNNTKKPNNASVAVPTPTTTTTPLEYTSAATLVGSGAARVGTAAALASGNGPSVTFKHEVQQQANNSAFGRAISGGLSGAIAMGINVGAFMWLRTIMSFQQMHGTPLTQAIRTLYKQGGIKRFYLGFTPALIQGPASRFGDTAANAGILSVLDGGSQTKELPLVLKTAFGSAASGIWRVLLMPLDTIMTVKQVEGHQGQRMLLQKLHRSGPCVLFQGAGAAFAANILGHYPWFAVYNICEQSFPEPQGLKSRLARNAAMGFLASIASDVLSNGLHVVKTCKQASVEIMSYRQTAQRIVAADGVKGLLGRGLTTKLFANGIQGMTFGIVWKFLDDCIFRGQCPELDMM